MSEVTIGPLSFRALRAVKARLERITTANGFNTNVVTVALGRRSFVEGELPAIAVYIPTETPRRPKGEGKAGEDVMIVNALEFHIAAFLGFDGEAEDEVEALERLKADIKRALFEAFTGAQAQARGTLTDYLSDDDGAHVTTLGFIYYDRAELATRQDGDAVEYLLVVATANVNERFGNPYRQN